MDIILLMTETGAGSGKEVGLAVYCFAVRDETTTIAIGDDTYYVETDDLRMFCRAVLAAVETKDLSAGDEE
jgi:hypothetical protein